jgi:hypothetical protein
MAGFGVCGKAEQQRDDQGAGLLHFRWVEDRECDQYQDE